MGAWNKRIGLGPLLLGALAAPLLIGAAPPALFEPAAPEFAEAADEYRAIWQAEGARIAAAMEKATGLPFPREEVEVLVHDGPAMTAYHGGTIWVRAAYDPAYKKALLIHEMGHRIAFRLSRAAGLDDHRLLYLFLYDVWRDLYGRDFADHMAELESEIPADYDYAAAWQWALSMSREERRAMLERLRPQLDYEQVAP